MMAVEVMIFNFFYIRWDRYPFMKTGAHKKVAGVKFSWFGEINIYFIWVLPAATKKFTKFEMNS